MGLASLQKSNGNFLDAVYSGATRSDRAIIPHRETAVSISGFSTS
ncbi:hypothetical protein [Nostoc favosum]|nr:hypothetical protein [Nostoc favosum]